MTTERRNAYRDLQRLLLASYRFRSPHAVFEPDRPLTRADGLSVAAVVSQFLLWTSGGRVTWSTS